MNNFFPNRLFKKVTNIEEIPPKKFHLKKIFEYISKFAANKYELYKSSEFFPVEKLSRGREKKLKEIYQIRYKFKSVYTRDGCSFGNHFNHLTWIFTVYKNLTNLLLQDLGLPVNSFWVCWSLDEISQRFGDYHFQKHLAAKPIDGSRGKDVYLEIKSKEELVEAAKKILETHPAVQIEPMLNLSGDFRIHCIGRRYYAGVQRIRANVVGDGKSEISKLIAEKNSKRESKPILVDEVTKELLGEQNLTLTSVPKKGQRVWLKRVSSFSQGGDVIDVSRRVNKRIIEQCEGICHYFQMGILGFDILTDDISKPLEETGGVILEVNNAPHWDVVYLVKRWKIVEDLLNYLFP